MRLWVSYLYQKKLKVIFRTWIFYNAVMHLSESHSGENVKTSEDIIFRFCYNLFNKTNIDMGEQVSVIAHISDLEM